MPAQLAALLKVGQDHQNSRRFQEAEACYRQALSLVPGQPSALYLLGTLEQQRGRLGSAVQFMRSAIAGNPNQPRFCIHLGSILMQQSKIEEALALIRAAIERLPHVAELHDGLGALLETKGLAAESFQSYQRAAALNPQLPRPHVNLAVHHIRQGRHEQAVEECQWALKLQPNSVEARLYLAAALINLGRHQDAIANLLAAQSLDPGHVKIAVELAHAYLLAGDPGAALAAARHGLTLKKNSTALLVYQYYALWELGMDAAALAIFDLQRLIFEETLDPPPEYPSQDAFHAGLIAALMNYPTLVWEPIGKTTRKGHQSGLLHEISLPETECLLRQLRQKLAAFIAALPGEQQHPFFGNKPAAYDLHAWATILEPGGHQEPHIHPSGWLSGVYYLAIPPEIAPESQAGWIEFGRHPQSLPLRRQPPVRTLQPEVGKLVLFPSYTYHRTLPFGGTARRISIAFDVIPRELS